MAALRELVAVFGIQVDDKDLKKADKAVDGLVGKLKQFAAVVGTAFLAKGAYEMVRGVAEVADGIDKTSIKLGISTDLLQEWQHAAGLAGVGADQLAMGFTFLQKNAFEAANGGKEAAAAFAKLGVNVKGPNGQIRDAGSLMNDVAAGLARTQNASERTALSMALLGKSGKDFLPLFNDGAEALAQARAEAHELGAVIEEDTIKASVALNDDITRLEAGVMGFKVALAREAIPALNWLVLKAKDGLRWFRELTRGTNVVRAAFVALGAVATVLAVKMLLPWIPAAVAVGALILVVDDLITLFEGGDSAIGAFADSLFGLGAANEVVMFLKQTWEDLVDTVEYGVVLFKESANVLRMVNNALGGDAKLFEIGETRAQKRERAQMDEDARARAEQMRRERLRSSPLDDIGRPGRLLLRPNPRASSGPGTRTVAAPASFSAGQRAGGSAVTQVNNVVINAQNANARQVADELERRKAAEMKRAAAALVPEGA